VPTVTTPKQAPSPLFTFGGDGGGGQYDQELGEAIELEYLRFMPFMNKALARLVQEEYPNYANDADDQVKVVPRRTGNAAPSRKELPRSIAERFARTLRQARR